jgi:hypothetical protein
MNKTTKSLISASTVLLAFQAQGWAQKIDVGKAEYLSSCASCHGSDAKGKGPFADELKVVPPDLTQLAKKNGGVFPLNAIYETIDGRQELKAHGSREMPIWGYRYIPFPNVPSNQAFDPKSAESYSIPPNRFDPKSTPSYSEFDFGYNPEVTIRNRILALIDYLYSVQEK